MNGRHAIAPILEHYGGVKAKENRNWHKILCPFHDDSTASATVNTQDNAFICFACGIKGDTYSIIMQKEGVTFREAIKIAERITGQGSDTLRSNNQLRGRVPESKRVISGRRSEGSTGFGRRATSRA